MQDVTSRPSQVEGLFRLSSVGRPGPDCSSSQVTNPLWPEERCRMHCLAGYRRGFRCVCFGRDKRRDDPDLDGAGRFQRGAACSVIASLCHRCANRH